MEAALSCFFQAGQSRLYNALAACFPGPCPNAQRSTARRAGMSLLAVPAAEASPLYHGFAVNPDAVYQAEREHHHHDE